MKRVLLPLFLLCLPIVAESSGILVGIITSSAGEPVRNTRIALVSVTGDIRRETTTDEIGTYAFSLLPDGSYVLEAPVHGAMRKCAGPVVLNGGEVRSWRVIWDSPK
jgi:Carboxypeptidase regulatory-like domain